MPTRTSQETAKKTTASSGGANALQRPLQPSEALAAVVGPGPLPRGEVVSKVVGLHQVPQPAEPGEPPRDPGRRQAQERLRQGQGDHVRDEQAPRPAPDLTARAIGLATAYARTGPRPPQPRSSDPTDDRGAFGTGWTSRTGRDVGVPTAIAGVMRETHRGYARKGELSARSWSMYPPLQVAILPAGAGFLGSNGCPPGNGLVNWDVDAVPECPISGGYQMFASSQTAGNADRFSPAAPHLPTIRSSGR